MHLYDPDTDGETSPANPDPEPFEAACGTARPRVEWNSLRMADAGLWHALVTRVVDTVERAGKEREVLSAFEDDLDAAVEAGAISLYGIPIQPGREWRSLSEVKSDALRYLEGVRGEVTEAAARAYRETVEEAEHPGPVFAAGRQLQKMVAALRTGTL